MPYRLLKNYLGSILILLCIACSQAPAVLLSTPTKSPVQVHIDPALAPVQPAIAECASRLDDLAVFTAFEINSQELPDLIVGYAKITELSHQYLLGSDTLGLAISNTGSLDPPTLEQVRLLYQTAPDSVHQAQGWIPLTYPETNLLRRLFDEVVLNDAENPHILIAPDPESIRTLLLEGPNHIAYLPDSWISPPLAHIPLPSSIKRELQLDIVAAAASAPGQNIQRLIDCMQSGAGQELLAEVYIPFTE